jgi:hypothetical protein
MTPKINNPLARKLYWAFICLLVYSFVVLFLNTYNTYFFSLGRLYRGIEQGQAYADVESKFLTYYEKHKDKGDIQMQKGPTNLHLMKGPISETKQLFIHHASFSDDVQLQVLFDDEDKVKEILFVGD